MRGECTRGEKRRDEGERKSYGREGEEMSGRQRLERVDNYGDKKGEVN